MDLSNSYCEAWPEALKQIAKAQYRAKMKVRNLEYNIERAAVEDFDGTIETLEAAKDTVQALALQAQKMYHRWVAEHAAL